MNVDLNKLLSEFVIHRWWHFQEKIVDFCVTSTHIWTLQVDGEMETVVRCAPIVRWRLNGEYSSPTVTSWYILEKYDHFQSLSCAWSAIFRQAFSSNCSDDKAEWPLVWRSRVNSIPCRSRADRIPGLGWWLVVWSWFRLLHGPEFKPAFLSGWHFHIMLTDDMAMILTMVKHKIDSERYFSNLNNDRVRYQHSCCLVVTWFRGIRVNSHKPYHPIICQHTIA